MPRRRLRRCSYAATGTRRHRHPVHHRRHAARRRPRRRSYAATGPARRRRGHHRGMPPLPEEPDARRHLRQGACQGRAGRVHASHAALPRRRVHGCPVPRPGSGGRAAAAGADGNGGSLLAGYLDAPRINPRGYQSTRVSKLALACVTMFH
jgi:hypothetical protein